MKNRLKTLVAHNIAYLRRFSDDFQSKTIFSPEEPSWTEAANYNVTIGDVVFGVLKWKNASGAGEKITEITITCGAVRFIDFDAERDNLLWHHRSQSAETHLRNALDELLRRIAEHKAVEAARLAEEEATEAKRQADREAAAQTKRAVTLARFGIAVT
jgi:hypothetical protein